MPETTCFICRSSSKLLTVDGDVVTACPKCGKYKFHAFARNELLNSSLNERQEANISGWLRQNQQLSITSKHVQLLRDLPTPTVAERANKILQTIERKTLYVGAAVDVWNLEFIGISSSINIDELQYLVNEYLAKEMNYVQHDDIDRPVITPKGYAALDELKHINTESQIGFCAMWFSTEVTPAWTEAIFPAIKDSGYDAKRIDTHDHNNRIDDEIIAMLRKSKFVVADFTGQRGGVYFEAGFALGLGLPVIWTVRKDALEEVHFDNRQYNFVVWEEDKLSEFKVALQNRIEATLGRGKLSN